MERTPPHAEATQDAPSPSPDRKTAGERATLLKKPHLTGAEAHSSHAQEILAERHPQLGEL